MKPGRLAVVSTPIGNLSDLSPRAAATLAEADLIACEDTRHTRKLLTHAGIRGARLVSIRLEASVAKRIIERLRQGALVALVSDAGTPAVSDPGQRLVSAAIAGGFEVVAVPGPSAALAALVVSGLPTDRFAVEGFLPRKGAERRRRLAELAGADRTTVLFEAPHRITATLTDLVEACGPARWVAVGRELTKLHEEVWRGPLADAVAAVGQPRGEYVVVLGPATPPVAPDDDAIRTVIAARIAGGDDRRTAVAAVAAELGVPKRRVYALSLGADAPPPEPPPGESPPGESPSGDDDSAATHDPHT